MYRPTSGRGVITALLALLLSSPPPLRAQTTSGTASGAATVVKPGDVVRINVLETPGLSGDITVAADSTLLHPRYVKLRVGGRSVAELRPLIDAYLRELQRDPQFTVEALVKVTVGGEVRSPSIYMLPAETTVGDALAKAGGVTPNGRLDRVQLYRDGGNRTLDLKRGNGADAMLAVRSGDQIVVPPPRPSIMQTVVMPIASLATLVVSTLTLLRR